MRKIVLVLRYQKRKRQKERSERDIYTEREKEKRGRERWRERERASKPPIHNSVKRVPLLIYSLCIGGRVQLYTVDLIFGMDFNFGIYF